MSQIFTAGILDGKVALITGGGTGIGMAVAEELGQLGASLAICGRRPEPLEEAADRLRAKGIAVFHETCDIRDPDATDAFVARVCEAQGDIDILINNAGGQFPCSAAQLSPKGFEAVIRNNLNGTFYMTRSVALSAFIPSKKGRIVNVIAQIARGFPGMAHTGAARAGVENLTKSLAVEWAIHGIRVNAVAPGVIRTKGIEQYGEMLVARARQVTPLKRIGEPEEVSHLITYLCLPQADFITGQTFYIDGGASLWGDQWSIPDDVPQTPPYRAE